MFPFGLRSIFISLCIKWLGSLALDLLLTFQPADTLHIKNKNSWSASKIKMNFFEGISELFPHKLTKSFYMHCMNIYSSVLWWHCHPWPLQVIWQPQWLKFRQFTILAVAWIQLLNANVGGVFWRLSCCPSNIKQSNNQSENVWSTSGHSAVKLMIH